MGNQNIIAPEPWEQQDGETPRPFEAFCVYRDMGPSRSLAKVGRKLGKSTTIMEEWSVKYDWVKRVQAWDAEQDRIVRDQKLREIIEMRERHAEIANMAMEKVRLALEMKNPQKMSNRDIATLMDVSSKLERLSRGDAGEVIEERDGGEALNPVQFFIPDNGRDKRMEKEEE